MKKIKLKMHVKIANIIMCIGGVITVYDMMVQGGKARPWVDGIAVLFIILGLFYRVSMVKCPQCNEALTGSTSLPETCERCGYKLTEDD